MSAVSKMSSVSIGKVFDIAHGGKRKYKRKRRYNSPIRANNRTMVQWRAKQRKHLRLEIYAAVLKEFGLFAATEEKVNEAIRCLETDQAKQQKRQ